MAPSLLPTFHGGRHGCLLPLLLLLLLVLAAIATSCSTSPVSVSVQSLFPSQSCSSPPQGPSADGGMRLRVVHQDGPCAPPLTGAARREPPSHAQLLAADQNRVDSIHRRAAASARRSPRHAPAPPGSSSSIPAKYGGFLGTGNYVVTVGLGTPAEELTVVFDTGSDVTWVQCQPCVAYCYKQRDPIFDPAKSTTYANISCGSPYCAELYVHGCSPPTCLYAVQYGDNSFTVGFYAQETLTLSPHDVLEKFRFGCGERNRGLFGQTAGLLGLGRGNGSLTVQEYARYGGVFAYCLPATSSGTGYLTFGAASPALANAKFTPLFTDMPTFYYVALVGICVGGEQLPIPQSVFAAAGTIVDSGTVITRLPPAAYSALKSAFMKAMAAYKAAPAYSILDTCYDFTGLDTVSLPTAALLFEGGASLDLDVSGIVYAVSVAQVCLAFAGNSDATSVAIVGNTQQKTFNVVHDVSKKVIGFGPRGC